MNFRVFQVGPFLFLTDDADASLATEEARRKSAQAETVILWASGSGITGETLVFDSQRKLQNSTIVGHSEFGLSVSAGAELSFDEDEQALVVAGAGITARLGALLKDAEMPVRGDRFRIRCNAENAGLVEFELEREAPFNASFRYFYGPKGSLNRLVYPAFPNLAFANPVGGPQRVQVCAVTNLRRVLMPQASAQYPSCFRTPLGLEVALGTTESSAFVLAYDPMVKEYYAVLDGQWTTNIQGAQGSTGQPPRMDLMLGTSGLEYAKTSAEWLLEWRSGGPAYAPFFAAGLTAVGPTALVSRITTGWTKK